MYPYIPYIMALINKGIMKIHHGSDYMENKKIMSNLSDVNLNE